MAFQFRTVFILALIFAFAGFARAGSAVTYHGRILDSADRPVEAQHVLFKIQVRSPGAANCLLYEETRSVDMRGSDGIFVIPIGDGIGQRSSADPGILLENVFSNNPALDHLGLSCNTDGHYQPQTQDSRKLIVTFNDGTGSGDQALPPMDVNYVPFALSASEALKALKIGTIDASKVMSVSSGAATPLSAANFSELMLLVNGSSSAYVKPSSVPACASGEVLKGTGGAFVCVTDASGTDTLAGISCADGKILKRSAGAWACADESGVGTESDPTVQPYAKVAPGTGLTVSAGALVPDFGTGAGKVAQGNDSRFTDARAPNGSATGDLSGSYPNPTVKGLRGNAIATTTPLNGQVYQWVLGSTEWQPKYLSFADLKKSDGTAQMPASCAANQTLAWSAITDVFTCADIGSLDASKITAGTLSASRLPADTMILTCADGKIAKRVAGAWACADDVGVGSEVDPSVAAYAKNPPATGLIVDGSNKIAPDFGTGAGKIVQGNDSRLSDNRVASDINGVVSTGILQRTGAGTFSTLGVAAPVTNSAGNIGLAVGAGLTLSSGSLVPDFGTASGKVAQGNDSRFPSSTCASGNYNRWNGSAWVCDADSATDSTKVLKSGDTMTGTLNLPANGLVVGTTQLAMSGGNVGIGTAAPGQKLTVAGTIESTTGGVKFPDGTTQTTAYTGGAGSGTVRRATAVYTGGGFTIPHNSATVLSFSSTLIDTSSFWSAGQPSRLTVPNGINKVRVCASVYFAGPSTSVYVFQTRIRKNGAIGAPMPLAAQHTTYGNYLASPVCSPVVDTVAGDYYDVELFQNSGSSGTVYSNYTYLSIEEVPGTTMSGNIAGSGTASYVPKFSAGDTLTNSAIVESGGNVGIGTASPTVSLDVAGGIRPGSSTAVTACGLGAANGEGTQRYNYTTHVMEYCNGTTWVAPGGPAMGTTLVADTTCANHAIGTTYTNSSSNIRLVSVASAMASVGTEVKGFVNGVQAGYMYSWNTTYWGANIVLLVPPGATYKVTGGQCWNWTEWQ